MKYQVEVGMMVFTFNSFYSIVDLLELINNAGNFKERYNDGAVSITITLVNDKEIAPLNDKE